ncbi:MAG: carbohydrate-binding domain-containing protein [Oscillospiraceae bacterium]|nr:carbohydrate-binding domain-containing protein [Oscillospiraceae bacterium]
MKNYHRFSHRIAGLLAAGAMCAALPVMTGNAALAGDINLDGQVNVQDIVLLQKYLLNKESITQQGFENADLNNDGKVNIYDLIYNKKQIITGQLPEQQPTETETETESQTETEGTVASIVYNGSGVTLYDINGAEVAAANATNVTADGAYVTITTAGEYSVSGTSDNGQLKVSTDNTVDATAAVTLNFEDLTLSNSSVAPVYVENVGDAVTISVKKGTTNTISDGTTHTDTYTNSSGEVKEINSAIFSRDDLKIKGKGTLIVNGNYQDGLVSKNDLKLWNGDIQVNAKDDGIKGGNSVRIGDPSDLVANGGTGDYSNLNITVKTEGGDGIKSTETDEGKGYVTLNGGTVNINSYADGIQAEQEFTMNGGDVTIYTYQGSAYGSSGSTSTDPWSGGMGQDGNSNKTDISAKGIKSVGLYDEAGTTWQSGGNLTINGGTLVIDSSDDALHCGGDMSVIGGILTLSSADDGMHSDHSLTIGTANAGTFDDVQIYIPKCYEGVEGVTINQNSGTVYIISDDDGYNAAGGADGSGTGNTNPWGGGMMSTSSGTLNLNGGFAVVNSANGDHDAFDSNGNFTVTGGYYCANGQEPLDYDGTFTNNGGSIITMTGGNTNLTTRYSFVDNSGNVIVSFLSASGGGAKSVNNCTAQSGGTVSGGTTVVEQAGDKAVTIGGTLSGGTALGQASESEGPGQGGPGQRW